MKEKWICLYRRKTGKCLWSEICELDQIIYNSQQNEMKCENKIHELKKQIQERLHMESLQFQLVEGDCSHRGWGPSVEEKVPDQCKYVKYDCAHICALKKRVQSYHFHKRMALMEHYNQWVMLAKTMLYEADQYLDSLAHKIVVSEKNPFLMLGCIVRTQKETNKIEEVSFEVFYIEELLKVEHISMNLKIYPSKEVLENTYLLPNPHAYFIEIKMDPILNKVLISQILMSIEKWIMKWNESYGTPSCWLEGWFCEKNDTNRSTLWEVCLSNASYHTIGRMVNGEYRENQVGLWRMEKDIVHDSFSKRNR